MQEHARAQAQRDGRHPDSADRAAGTRVNPNLGQRLTGLGRPLGEAAVVTGAVRPAAVEHLVARSRRSGFPAPPAHLHRGGISAQDISLLIDHDQAVRQLVVDEAGCGLLLGTSRADILLLNGHSNPPNQQEIWPKTVLISA